MREIQTDPKLSIYLNSESIAILMKNLVITNIGLGPAYNVKFELNPDFTLLDGTKLSEVNLIKNGISYMAPQYKFEFLLSDYNYFKKYADISFKMKVSYQNSFKKRFEEEFTLDFSVWKNMEIVDPVGFSDVVKELEKININLKELKKT